MQFSFKIEGLRIGGKELGLFNYKRANNIKGAAGRNKFKEEKVRDVRFAGDGFLALDRGEYAEMEAEMRMSLRADKVDGILIVAGDTQTRQYVGLELRNGYLSFR